QRVGGTVMGGIVAALIVHFVGQPLLLGGLLFILACAGVAVRRINYAAFATLVTPVFGLLAEANARGAHLTRARIFDTLLGGALALAGGVLLWPTRDLERMPSLVAAVLRANQRYLRAVLGGEGPGRTVAARRAVGLATANAEAALQRLIGESRPADGLEPLMALVAYARRLSASITALGPARFPAACALRSSSPPLPARARPGCAPSERTSSRCSWRRSVFPPSPAPTRRGSTSSNGCCGRRRRSVSPHATRVRGLRSSCPVRRVRPSSDWSLTATCSPA